MTETLFTSVGGNTSCAANLSASGAVQEYEVITMTCSITYSGNWAPVMRWFNSRAGVNYTEPIVDNRMTTVTSQITDSYSVCWFAGLSDCLCYLLRSTVNTSSDLGY